MSLSYNRLRFLEILQSEFESGVLIVAENIYSIDKILFRLPQYVADIQRRKTIIAITNTTDLEFDTLTVDILTKLFNLVTIANVLLITPCQSDPEVCERKSEITKITEKYIFFRLFEHIFPFNLSHLEILQTGAHANFFIWRS